MGMPDVLSAVAEPTRRRILQELASGELSVNELAAGFTVTRSAISQHLRVLADVGLVHQRKDGRRRFYRLDPAGMRSLRLELDRFWTRELDSLVVEAASRQTPESDDSPEEDSVAS